MYFLTNFSVALGVYVLERWLENPKLQIVIQALSGAFFHPLALFVFIFLAFTIHILSLLMRGKGKFRKTFSAMGIASYPLILLFIPWVAPFGIAWWGYLLIFSVKKIYHYKYRYAVISVGLPLVILIIILIIIGFFGISF